MLTSFEIGQAVGASVIWFAWFGLNAYSIYRAFKQNHKKWKPWLIGNAAIGIFLPLLLTIILPIIYLVKTRKPKTFKQKLKVLKAK